MNISNSDTFSKYVCIDCEQKICTFDEFYIMVANVQKQLAAPSLEIDFTEVFDDFSLCKLTFQDVLIMCFINFQSMLCQLKANDTASKNPLEKQGSRKSICPICAKSFRCQAHLNRHKRIHTGQRPFICNVRKIIDSYILVESNQY